MKKPIPWPPRPPTTPFLPLLFQGVLSSLLMTTCQRPSVPGQSSMLLDTPGLLCVLRILQCFRQGQAAGWKGLLKEVVSFLLELLACLSSLCACGEHHSLSDRCPSRVCF